MAMCRYSECRIVQIGQSHSDFNDEDLLIQSQKQISLLDLLASSYSVTLSHCNQHPVQAAIESRSQHGSHVSFACLSHSLEPLQFRVDFRVVEFCVDCAKVGLVSFPSNELES